MRIVIFFILASLLVSNVSGIRLDAGFKSSVGETAQGSVKDSSENDVVEALTRRSLAAKEHYVDNSEISVMDYSPARRKSPIHN